MQQVRNARQVWLEIDVDDFVVPGCKWAEVSDNLYNYDAALHTF